MRKLFTYGILAGLLTTSITVAAQPVALSRTVAVSDGLKAPAVAAIDRIVNEAVRNRTLAGAAVGVAYDGRIVFVRGYGSADLENRVPVGANTVFRIGSVTKQFTAAAVLKLADQGKLSVDDPLSKYFPNFPRGAEVTLRQLLNHTSGISNYTGNGFFVENARKEWPTEAMATFIAGQKPVYGFEPGSAWNYSNSGYILLGGVVEKVSGKSFAAYLKDEILTPLALRDTAIDDLQTVIPNRARGYDKPKGPNMGFTNATFLSMSAAAAAGAMRSTASDLVKWHSALFSGRVLKPASLALMIEPGRLKDGRVSSAGWSAEMAKALPPAEYGFGLFTGNSYGRRSVGHGGSINGFNTWMETFPDDRITMVLLTNTNGAAAETGRKLADAFFKARKP